MYSKCIHQSVASAWCIHTENILLNTSTQRQILQGRYQAQRWSVFEPKRLYRRSYSALSLSAQCIRPQVMLRSKVLDMARAGCRGIKQPILSSTKSCVNRQLTTLHSCRITQRRASGSRRFFSQQNEPEESFIQERIASLRSMTTQDYLRALRRLFSLSTLRSIFRLEMRSTSHPTFWGRVRWQAVLQFKVLVVVCALGYSIQFMSIGIFHLYQEFVRPTDEALSWDTRCYIHYLKLYEKKNMPIASQYGLEVIRVMDKDTKKEGGWEYTTFDYKRAVAAVWIFVARLQQQTGFDGQAIEIYQRALDTEPGVVDGPERADVLMKMADAYTMLKKYDEAFDCLYRAVDIAATIDKIPVDPRNPVFQDTKNKHNVIRPSTQLLDTITAVAAQYSKAPPKQPGKSLPIFLSLLRVLQALPVEERDLCREAWVMSFLGEVIFALGKRVDGYGWTMKGLEISEAGAGEVSSCKDCANYAVRNAITMKKELGLKGSEDEKEVANLRRRQRLLAKYDDYRI